MALAASSNVIETVAQLLSQENGLAHRAEIVRILLNEAMKVERAQALEAEPHQRSTQRRGYANCFKPKTVNIRLGRDAGSDPAGARRGGITSPPHGFCQWAAMRMVSWIQRLIRVGCAYRKFHLTHSHDHPCDEMRNLSLYKYLIEHPVHNKSHNTSRNTRSTAITL
jgi:hypothetical protein